MNSVSGFYRKNERQIALGAGVMIFLFLYLFNPLQLDDKASTILAIAGTMITWWVSSALPLPVVALMPLVLFPVFHINNIKTVTAYYADSMIFLFMGGFFIALAIEKWHLHKRIALSIIRVMGTNGNKIILGFIIATGFLSLWLSNTATTMMMYPIAMSVITVINENPQPGTNPKNFSLVLMLSIAYASNFALGTIIGTPPNVAYVSYLQEKFNFTISFADWMLVFMPLTICMMWALYMILVKWLFPNRIMKTEAGGLFIKEELSKMGKLTTPEKKVLIVFLITVLLWTFKDVINEMNGWLQLDDTMIAMAGGLILFIIPSGKYKIMDNSTLLDWKDTKNMSWGILILFGGGIALAKELENARLMDKLGEYIASYSSNNLLIMILVVTTLSIFLSEVMSNVAQVIVMAPVVSSVAIALKMDPLLLGLPMTLGASAASMLPMGTPPNAIVFASGYIRMKDMLKAGLVLNLVSIILITLFCYLLQPLILNLIA